MLNAFRYRFANLLIRILLVVLFGGYGGVQAADLDVKHFELENGMLFLVVERHAAPQVACRLAIRAGSALESRGETGIAHLLEHMMFKGTKNFGTLDYKKDERLQERIEAAYQTILAEQRKRNPDPDLIREKRAEMADLRRQVQQIYVPQAFSLQLERNGAIDVNAFTTKDQTQYTVSVPADMVEQWFSIISEQVFEPSWRELYVEKEIVQREWAYRYLNRPFGAAWLDLNATAYQAHPYRNPTIGWKSDMAEFNTIEAEGFHRTYYNPTNAVCVLVGDVDFEAIQRLARIYFGRYPAGPRAPETVTREPAQSGSRTSIRYLKGARTPLVLMGFHGPAMGTSDFYALDALTMILSYGRGARLQQKIVQKGLAQQAWSSNSDNRYAGMFMLGGSPNEPAPGGEESGAESSRQADYHDAATELVGLLRAEIDQLARRPPEIRELERIKKLSRRDFLDRLRSNEDLAGTLATLEVQIGADYLDTYLQKLDAVKPRDVSRVIRTYLGEDRQTTVFVLPGGAPQKPPEPYTEVRSAKAISGRKVIRAEDFENHSNYPTPDGWRHPLSFERTPHLVHYPEAQQETLQGATVFYLPDRQLPLIDLALFIKAGEVDIDADHQGLGQLLSQTLVQGGAADHSPEQLADILDRNAIRLSMDVGEESSVIRMSVIKQDWQLGLELLQAVLTRPQFDDRVLETAKNQSMIALKRQGEDAQAVAMRESQIAFFDGHPYGRDPLTGLQTIPHLSREDLKAFMDGFIKPSNIVAAVSGDIDKQEALAGLKAVFSSLSGGSAAERNLQPPAPPNAEFILIHKPGQVQSQVVLSLPGPQRTDPGYWKLNLLMHVFGGSDSLLYTRLRDDLGLVYSAGFFQTYKWKAGMLVGYIGCRGDRTRQAVEETVRIMSHIREDGISSADLEQKRLDTLNSFVFNVDSPRELVDVYSRYEMRHEPLNTLERIQKAFISARQDELKRLARRYLDPDRMQIVVVADKAALVSDAQGTQQTLEADMKDLAADLKIPFREIPLR